MQKIFLDTNIILDFLGERNGFYLPAAKILTLADFNKIKIFASPISISTTFYVLSKVENQKIALEKIKKFKLLCNISIMNDKVIDKAISANFKDFEDALQYFSAIESKCEAIITRNEKDFKNALIPVMQPSSFLQTMVK